MYRGLHHAALVVSDLERARRFYEEALGFQVSGDRPAFDFDGIWYAFDDGTQLHLIVPRDTRAREANRTSVKDGHFALRVADIQAVLALLDRHGIAYNSLPDSITGWHQVFVRDPEGNRIEFNAPLDKRQ